MQICVNLYGGLEKYSKEGKRKNNLIKVSEGSSLRDVISLLEIPEEEVKIMMVNGLHTTFNYIIKEKDEISLFPLLFGG